MYRSNKKILDYLKSEGYTDIHNFPHLRFLKDYIINNLGFDCIAWKKYKHKNICWVFQFKTNKKIPKKTKELYKEITKKYFLIPCWISTFDRKKELFIYYPV